MLPKVVVELAAKSLAVDSIKVVVCCDVGSDSSVPANVAGAPVVTSRALDTVEVDVSVFVLVAVTDGSTVGAFVTDMLVCVMEPEVTVVVKVMLVVTVGATTSKIFPALPVRPWVAE